MPDYRKPFKNHGQYEFNQPEIKRPMKNRPSRKVSFPAGDERECNRCGDLIVWLKSQAGKSYPVNYRGGDTVFAADFHNCGKDNLFFQYAHENGHFPNESALDFYTKQRNGGR